MTACKAKERRLIAFNKSSSLNRKKIEKEISYDSMIGNMKKMKVRKRLCKQRERKKENYLYQSRIDHRVPLKNVLQSFQLEAMGCLIRERDIIFDCEG